VLITIRAGDGTKEVILSSSVRPRNIPLQRDAYE